mmetsp:Transcript_29511/g.34211  ORF Transcript_29511/g.34211 Transcript_29511/m.34211 type:complete len:133 (-) Transcript_29511:149-547(-)
MLPSTRLTLFIFVACFLSECHAFTSSLLQQQQRISQLASSNTNRFLVQSPRHPAFKSTRGTTLFQAKPKINKNTSAAAASNKKKNVKKVEEKESPKGLSLVLVYMTPWRNPNSIFVYMFGLLYALGKYSESH